jgi:hypothetical protein
MVGSVLWLFGKRIWDQTKEQDPQKVFAQEVFQTVQARLPWAATNGSGASETDGKVWSQVGKDGDDQ